MLTRKLVINQMSCNICGKIGTHDIRCPNYIEKKYSRICKFCKEKILFGEKYIENDFNEVVHLDCLDSIEEAVKFLGYKVEEK